MGNVRECSVCGDEIPKERLKLVPGTCACINCQESIEKRGLFQRSKMSVNYNFRCGEIEETFETIVKGETV